MAMLLPASPSPTIAGINTIQFNGNRSRRETLRISHGIADAASGTIENVKTSEIVNGWISARHGVRHVAPLKSATAVTAAAMLHPSIRSQ